MKLPPVLIEYSWNLRFLSSAVISSHLISFEIDDEIFDDDDSKSIDDDGIDEGTLLWDNDDDDDDDDGDDDENDDDDDDDDDVEEERDLRFWISFNIANCCSISLSDTLDKSNWIDEERPLLRSLSLLLLLLLLIDWPRDIFSICEV